MEFPEKQVNFQVTFHSLVGICGKSYPLSFGNYCGLGQYYCANMWAENIEEFKRRNPEITEVKVKVFDRICVVIDERIPKEWRNSFCLTGSGYHKLKYLKPLLEYCNQPLDRYICGCETEDQTPSSMGSYNMKDNFKTYTCTLCKRERKIYDR